MGVGVVLLFGRGSAIVALLLSWFSVATGQETTAWDWDAMRARLEKQAVEVKVSGIRRDVVAIDMEKSDTFESGPLNLLWSRRQVAEVRLLEIGKDLYVVLSSEGTSSVKAPLGAWRVDDEGVPGLREGNWLVAGEGTRGFLAMPGVGDRIQGDVRGGQNPQGGE